MAVATSNIDWNSIMGNDAQISEAQLKLLIPRFYARVCDDVLIGSVFNDATGDWKHHLQKLVDFWSSVMLTSGRYKGNPVAAHLKHLPAITPQMFDRWLVLWSEVTGETLSPDAAVALQSKAARIAESLKLALYFRLAPAPNASLRSFVRVSPPHLTGLLHRFGLTSNEWTSSARRQQGKVYRVMKVHGLLLGSCG